MTQAQVSALFEALLQRYVAILLAGQIIQLLLVIGLLLVLAAFCGFRLGKWRL